MTKMLRSIFYALVAHAAFSSATDDLWQNIDFLSATSPVTISFITLNKNGSAFEIYNKVKHDLNKQENLPIAFDDKNSTMTFMMDPLEVEACLKATEYGQNNELGNPFKHLTPTISGNDKTVGHSFSFSDHSLLIEWQKQSRKHSEDIRALLCQAALRRNDEEKSKPRQSLRLKKCSKKNLLDSVLSDHRGVVIGETHDDPYPKQFLKRSINILAKHNVEAIFIENLPFDTMATALMEAAAKKDATLIPHRMKKFIMDMDNRLSPINGNPGYFDLIQEATSRGIAAIPIDTTHSRLVGWDRKFGISDRKNRLLAMNFVAADIVKAWMKKNPHKKFVVLTGFFHAGNYFCTLDERPYEIVGLADRLGVPNIFIGGTEKRRSRIRFNDKADNVKKRKLSKFSVTLRKSRREKT